MSVDNNVCHFVGMHAEACSIALGLGYMVRHGVSALSSLAVASSGGYVFLLGSELVTNTWLWSKGQFESYVGQGVAEAVFPCG